MREEVAEMEEQEELARQEQGLRDLRARQEVEEVRARAAQGGDGAVTAGGQDVERDLDDEIPDADAVGAGHGDEDVDLDADVEEAEDLTFNEDSIVDGSHILHQRHNDHAQDDYAAAQEEAELTGAARDEEDLGIEHEVERDLDDSVPEAGSYQHTDTELEDSSSQEEDSSALRDSFAGQSARRASRHPNVQSSGFTPLPVNAGATASAFQGGLQERITAQTAASTRGVAAVEALPRSPRNWDLSSSLLESSFVGSSPVAQRGRGGRRRGLGGRAS